MPTFRWYGLDVTKRESFATPHGDIAAIAPTPSAALAEGDLVAFAESLSPVHHPFTRLLLSPDAYARVKYAHDSVALWTLPGYRKMRGPDGKTWIEDRIWNRKGAKHGYGHGNKAKRRIGMDPLAIERYRQYGYRPRPERLYAPWEKEEEGL